MLLALYVGASFESIVLGIFTMYNTKVQLIHIHRLL